jgi:hypothetical protein
MAERDRLPHLRISGFRESRPFSTAQSARGRFRIAEKTRASHGRELLRQLEDLTPLAKARIEEQHRSSEEIPNGIYLQFESESGFELAAESLEREASGIELLSVVKGESREYATVFVPEGKLVLFERKVKAYLEENHRVSGKPLNEKLINNIANIRLATVRSLWTDDPALYPANEDSAFWWDVWLRVGDDRESFVRVFREHGIGIGLEIPERELRFLERTVISVKGSVRQLTRSVLLLNCVAELRRLKSPNSFFLDQRLSEQREWVDDALRRLEGPGSAAPSVCLLDTGVTRAHPLLENAFAAADVQSVNPAWSTSDLYGHGSLMAGLALYGDVGEFLAAGAPEALLHRGESVKVLDRDGDNVGALYGDICREAIARAEIAAPRRARSICLAVTAKEDMDRGKPSSWSATLDGLAAGSEDENRRLILVSAGNTDPAHYDQYPNSNITDSIHDPAQAWNVVTVGGVTYKTDLDPVTSSGWNALAPGGDLSPYSCTSVSWEPGWPLKPDIVLEGGNMATTAGQPPSGFVDLDLLSTHHEPAQQLLASMWGTSAATALAGRLSARIQAHYPQLWHETVRALLVHSADWTAAMKARFRPDVSRSNVRALLQTCGYGVPSEAAALYSVSNALTLVVEAELTPFEAVPSNSGGIGYLRAREMNLHSLPWPTAELEGLGALEVEMKVTLSYFIEPNPSARGWTKRYLYESHGLRFDIKRPFEDDEDFVERINLKARAEEDAHRSYASSDEGWLIGPMNRNRGSLHSDRWRGPASDLAARGRIAVYPTMGWWRERKRHERWNRSARYALVVSIVAPEASVDLYTAVKNQLAIPISVRRDD